MPKKSSFHKVISLGLIFSFLLNELVLPSAEEIQSQKMRIPAEWGHIQASATPNDTDVIIIADSHCVPGVQKRIHFILRLLARQGFRHVALEGAHGEFNSGFFQMMPDQKTARQVAGFWMNEGALTGAELASIFSSDEIHLYGIESRSTYVKSVHIVREAQADNPVIEKKRALFENEWPSVHLLLEQAWNEFEKGTMPLNHVLKMSFLNVGTYGYLLFPELMHVLSGREISDFMKFWMEMENLRYLAAESESVMRQTVLSTRSVKFCSLIRRMAVFQMTRREWELYKLLKENLTAHFSDSVLAESRYEEIHGGNSVELRTKTHILFSKLTENLMCLEEFYDLCRKRDRILAEGFVRYHDQNKFKRGVIIAGGFHLQGLLNELRRKGFHPAVLFPESGGGISGDADYLKVLLGGQRTERDFQKFAANAISWSLAPSPRLGFQNLQGEFIQKAFFASSIALYEILAAARSAGPDQDWQSILRENREQWKKGYSEWLEGSVISDEERRELIGVFDFVKIQSFKKENSNLEVMLELFGYQTRIRISLGPESDKANVLNIEFPERPPFQALSDVLQSKSSHAVIRRTLSGHFSKKLKARSGDAAAIRDYVDVYNRAWFLRDKLSREGGWGPRLKSFIASSDRPRFEKIYGALGKPIQKRGKFLKMLKEEMSARGIDVDFEIVDPEDPRIQGHLISCENGIVLIHPDARAGDVLFYLPHEMVHLAGGREIEGRTMDVQMIALLKGLAEKLRKSVKKSEFRASEYLDAKADLIELDALDWELDIHTARLERFHEGQIFLKRNSLGRLEDVSAVILDEMAGAASHVIDSIPFRLGSGSDDLAGIVQVLDDKSLTASDRRRLFDMRLLRIIMKKFLENSIRGYIIKKYGQPAEPETISSMDQDIQKKNRFNISRGFVYVFISAILGGAMPLMGQHLMQSYSVYSVLLVRDFIVGILLIPFVISKKVQNPTWKQFALISLLGFIMTGIGDPLYYEGIRRSSAVSAFLIYSSATLFLMTLASRFIFKEHLSLKKWIGAILTFSSALLIALGEASSSTASTILGSLMVFGSAIAAAIWTILAKNLLKNLNPIFLIAIAFWTGLPILLILSGGNVAVAASPLIWVFGGLTALVYILYYKGLKWVSALTVSILDLTSPMFTSLFSAIQRMHIPGLSELGALVLSTVGVLTYISATKKSKPHKKKQSDSKLDEWLLFGKEVAMNLESYTTADDGMTIPQVVDVSDLEEDYGPSDILEALSYYVHQSNVPNSDVYGIIFRRLGNDRGMKLLLDARQDIREYLDTEENISDEVFDEQMRVAKSIENELKNRFFSQAPYKDMPLERHKARQALIETLLAQAA